jgi:hypothetical protein
VSALVVRALAVRTLAVSALAVNMAVQSRDAYTAFVDFVVANGRLPLFTDRVLFEEWIAKIDVPDAVSFLAKQACAIRRLDSDAIVAVAKPFVKLVKLAVREVVS